MKTNQLRELHTKTTDELQREIRDIRAEILNQEREWVHGKLKNTNLIRNLKKDVARYMTVLHTKQSGAVVESRPNTDQPMAEETEKKTKKAKKEETK